MDIYSTR